MSLAYSLIVLTINDRTEVAHIGLALSNNRATHTTQWPAAYTNSTFNIKSISDWPIVSYRELAELHGDGAALAVSQKSVSGENFCPREIIL